MAQTICTKEGKQKMETATTFCGFEAHTKGTGSRLLAQMGYKGQGTGLGRHNQGIAEPLQIPKKYKSPSRLGLGSETRGRNAVAKSPSHVQVK